MHDVFMCGLLQACTQYRQMLIKINVTFPQPQSTIVGISLHSNSGKGNKETDACRIQTISVDKGSVGGNISLFWFKINTKTGEASSSN